MFTLNLLSSLLISTSIIIPSTSASYSLTRSYSGNDFFTRWSYYGYYELVNILFYFFSFELIFFIILIIPFSLLVI